MSNWYFSIANLDQSIVYSSLRCCYVPVEDAGYRAWLASDIAHVAIPVGSIIELKYVLGRYQLLTALTGVDDLSNIDKLRALMLAKAAAARWAHEVSGITYNNLSIPTDEGSQIKFWGAAIFAKDNPTYAANWKLPSGFVVFAANDILAIAEAIRAHIQQCFDQEKRLQDTIKTAKTIDALNAIDFTTGWPN